LSAKLGTPSRTVLNATPQSGWPEILPAVGTYLPILQARLQSSFAAGLARIQTDWSHVAGLHVAKPQVAIPQAGDPHGEAPLDLTITGNAGALRIAWNHSATGLGARLEIVDGARHTAIPVSPDLSNVTYEPEGGDVEVQLSALNPRESGPGDAAAPRSERGRFVGDFDREKSKPPPGLDFAHTEVVNLQQEMSSLRAAIESSRAEIASLQKKLRRRIEFGGK
jgi:hypothetical protein